MRKQARLCSYSNRERGEIAHVSEGENRWWSVQQINFRTEHSCQETDGEQEGYRG